MRAQLPPQTEGDSMRFSSEIKGNIMVFFIDYVTGKQLLAPFDVRQITLHRITNEVTNRNLKAAQCQSTLDYFFATISS